MQHNSNHHKKKKHLRFPTREKLKPANKDLIQRVREMSAYLRQNRKIEHLNNIFRKKIDFAFYIF